MICWNETISIIQELFELQEQDIAYLLGVSKTTLSKVKLSRQNASSKFIPNALYRKIFNPNTKGSPAFGKDEKDLLSTLRLIIEEEFANVRENLGDSWNSEDYRTFVMKLLELTRRDISPPVTAKKKPVIDSKSGSEQLQELFLKAIHGYKIMDIINREPAILNRYDAADLNNFLRDIETILPAYNSCDVLLLTSIESFSNALRIQALSLDATLNNRFSFENENASVNMEDSDIDSVSGIEVKNRLELPEWSIELVESAKDPLHLLRVGISEWGNFRSEMNCLFERIRSWGDKEAE